MSTDVLHDDFEEKPYWWDAAPVRRGDLPDLPARADVVIVGSGYTGLSAALTLARAGREVVVLDRDAPGAGASSRNAGYVGTALLAPFTKLLAQHGAAKAVAYYGQAKAAFDYTTTLIEREQIRCQYNRSGRIYWAYTQRQLDGLALEFTNLNTHLGKEGRILRGDEIAMECGSELYCGGLLIPETGALHPALFLGGLIERAEAAGASIIGETEVLGIAPATGGHRLETARGNIEAKNVIVATNGYTGRSTPWFQRRMLPALAHMIATEPLDPGLVKKLLPSGRTNLDARSTFHYWRGSPDGTRLLFGGRTGLSASDPETSARAGHAEMAEIFPELEGARITHYWNGRLGLTRDHLPRIGLKDGVHFAMGMNGAGLPMGTYLGHKAALRVLGDGASTTEFDALTFKTIPFYTGNPWFVPTLARLERLKHLLERPPPKTAA